MGKGLKRATPFAHPKVPDDVPVCEIARDGGAIVIVMRTDGLVSAGGRFEVVPVSGPLQPTPEEAWTMTTGSHADDRHTMTTTPANLLGDGLRFRINLCGHSPQQPDGVVDVRVEQDGVECPVVPPMHFVIEELPMCQSAADKVTPKAVVGGFAFSVQ